MKDVTTANIATYNDHSAVARYLRDEGLYAVEREIVEAHFPPPPARILDLGCGAGRTTVELVARGYWVTAVDLATEMVQAARQRAPGAHVLQMDATRLGLRTHSFDACLFSFNGIDCIHPAGERDRVLAEVARVLKPGGVFCFSSHNAPATLGRNLVTESPLRAARLGLAFLLQQRGNRHLPDGYWRFRDAGGEQLLYSTSPRPEAKALGVHGFQLQSVYALARYKDSSRLRLPWAGSALRRAWDQARVRLSYPHVLYVAITSS